MKSINKLWITALIFVIFSSVALAQGDRLDVELTYGDIDLDDVHTGVTAPGFTMSVAAGEKISIVVDVEKLFFVFEDNYEGIYYQVDANSPIEQLDLSNVQYVDMIINDGLFAITLSDDLFAVGVPQSQANSLGFDMNSKAFTINYLGTRPNAIELEGLNLEGNILALLDSEDMLFYSKTHEFSLHNMPLTLKIIAPVGANVDVEAEQQEATLEAAEEIEITATGMQTTAECVDMDENAADPYLESSYAYTSTGLAMSDWCQYDILSEATCTPEGALLRVEHDCGSAGCENGHCETNVQELIYCADTDQDLTLAEYAPEDLESVFMTKGATAGYYAATTTAAQSFGIFVDYCSSPTSLVEYHCKNDRARFSTIHCSSCDEGMCRYPFCLDTDGGEHSQVAGTIKGLDSNAQPYTFIDTCIDATTLREYSCDINEADGYTSVNTVCSSGCDDLAPGASKCHPELPPPPPPAECADDTECDNQPCILQKCEECGDFYIFYKDTSDNKIKLASQFDIDTYPGTVGKIIFDVEGFGTFYADDAIVENNDGTDSKPGLSLAMREQVMIPLKGVITRWSLDNDVIKCLGFDCNTEERVEVGTMESGIETEYITQDDTETDVPGHSGITILSPESNANSDRVILSNGAEELNIEMDTSADFANEWGASYAEVDAIHIRINVDDAITIHNKLLTKAKDVWIFGRENRCAQGLTCNGASGKCGEACTSYTDCGATGAVCSSGFCEECTVDADCTDDYGQGAICRTTPDPNECEIVAGMCTDDYDCPMGDICVASGCIPGCRNDLGCPAGKLCQSNACVDEPVVPTDITHESFVSMVELLERRYERLEALEAVIDELVDQRGVQVTTDIDCIPNHVCEGAENAEFCPIDCICGDGVCDSSENANTCSDDCVSGGGVPQGQLGQIEMTMTEEVGPLPPMGSEPLQKDAAIKTVDQAVTPTFFSRLKALI